MRILQVGIGDWGLNWAADITPQVTGAEIVGFVSKSRNRVLQAGNTLGVGEDKFFLDLSDAFRACDPEAVLVLTTTESHADLIEACILAGKPVLVEKPFADSVETADALMKLAKQKDVPLLINQNFRYYPGPERAMEIVRNRDLGDLGEVDVRFRRNIKFPDLKKSNWHQQMIQPLILDLGIHHFDLMRMVVGAEADWVAATAAKLSWSNYRDPASAAALIRFKNGVTVRWQASWISRLPETTFSGDWEMDFANGAVSWASRGDRDVSLKGERLAIYKDGAKHTETLPSPRLFGRAALLADFIKVVNGKGHSEFLPMASDNVRSLELAHGVVSSVRSGQTVTF